MKKLFIITIIGAILISLASCSSDDNLLINNDVTTDIMEKTEIDAEDVQKTLLDRVSSDIQDWQKAYIVFISEFSILEDYEICQYALRDVNLDGVPDLILLQSNASTALLEIYSFNGGVFKTGNYTDVKVGSALRVSYHQLYPGLFTLRWGGGVEHYGYITIDEDLLVYEYLWFNNMAPEEVANEIGQSGKNIVSDNKELVELSENIFLNENKNILEMISTDDDKFKPIINY